MARVIHTIGVTVVVALGTTTATAAAAQQARSPAAPAVSAEYRSYVSFLQGRAWAEAAEQAARDAAAVPVAEPGSAWRVVGIGAGAAAALALAGGTIVLGRRGAATALRPGPKSL